MLKKFLYYIILIIFIMLTVYGVLFFKNKNTVTSINKSETDHCEEELSLTKNSTSSCHIIDDIILTYHPDEKIEIKRVSTNKIINTFVCGDNGEFYFNCDTSDTLVYVVDINKDGYRDLGINILNNIRNREFTFYTYDPINDSYIIEESLDSIANPKLLDNYTITGHYTDTFGGFFMVMKNYINFKKMLYTKMYQNAQRLLL
jgi:hypothetical protein